MPDLRVVDITDPDLAKRIAAALADEMRRVRPSPRVGATAVLAALAQAGEPASVEHGRLLTGSPAVPAGQRCHRYVGPWTPAPDEETGPGATQAPQGYPSDPPDPPRAGETP